MTIDTARKSALDQMDRTERNFKFAFFLGAIVELGFIASFLLMAWYVGTMLDRHAVPNLGGVRGEERSKSLREINAAGREALNSYGKINEGKGVYTIYFTAFDGDNPKKIEPLWHDGYGNVWRMQVKLVEGKM